MGLWAKLSDVLRADLNDLLDKASDPIKQLNLMIEDMKDFRGKQAAEIGKAVAALKMVESDLAAAAEAVVRWDHRAERAARAGNDANAKVALKEQIQQEGLVKTLEAALGQHRRNVETLKLDLASLDQKIDELESKRAVVEVRVRTAEAQKGLHGPISSRGHAPNAGEVLDRVEGQVRRKEAEAAAAQEVAGLQHPVSAEEQFTAADTDDEVERRLAALKAAKETK